MFTGEKCYGSEKEEMEENEERAGNIEICLIILAIKYVKIAAQKLGGLNRIDHPDYHNQVVLTLKV